MSMLLIVEELETQATLWYVYCMHQFEVQYARC
jgi:hypothetical protein